MKQKSDFSEASFERQIQKDRIENLSWSMSISSIICFF